MHHPPSKPQWPHINAHVAPLERHANQPHEPLKRPLPLDIGPVSPPTTRKQHAQPAYTQRRLIALVLGLLLLTTTAAGLAHAAGWPTPLWEALTRVGHQSSAGHGDSHLSTSTATETAASPLPTPLPSLANDIPLPAFCPKSGPLPAGCMACPYFYTSTAPSRDQERAALDAAAAVYHLPRALLYAEGWAESTWHEDVISCAGDIGLMQLARGQWQTMDGYVMPACGISATAYDPYTLAGNALLGAKLLAWLRCYFSFVGGHGWGTMQQPADATAAWYYAQAGRLFPDDLLPSGQANPDSLCAAVAHDLAHPEYAALAPASLVTSWSCPFAARAGDNTVLMIVVSAYNAGAGTIEMHGITNAWYVARVTQLITWFGTHADPPSPAAAALDQDAALLRLSATIRNNGVQAVNLPRRGTPPLVALHSGPSDRGGSARARLGSLSRAPPSG